MSKLALYRYYRPKKFSEVIGQKHIVSTLRNQVKNGHISHAYLFSGSRGTGKTSTAQILARAVNCLTPEEGEPCGHCDICVLASNPDVWEIDAASNNGVDQIRDLRDKVRFAPLESRYKVYIIDEVHMLSDGAFNALLKTLEEPPEHAVFILATTEPQKLPATILSRCQRFDFHRIETEAIRDQLAGVLNDQGIRYDLRALDKIALLADGGMRDALSMLDQCIAFAGQDLSYEQVLEILGNVDDSLLYSLGEAIFAGQGDGVLRIIGDALQQGRDVGVLARDLLAYMRSLLLSRVSGPSAAAQLRLDEEEWQRRNALASGCDLAVLLEACDVLAKLDAQLRRATQPRILLETSLLQICLREQITQAAPPAVASIPQKAEVQVTTAAKSAAPKEDAPPKKEIAPTANAEKIEAAKAPETKETPPPSADCTAAFDLLVSRQGAGIQPIFKMYHWLHQFNGNCLELVAPVDCLPALLQTLKNNVGNFSETLQSSYPGIEVKFVDALSADPRPAAFAPVEKTEKEQNEPGKKAEDKKDLFATAVDLFGDDIVVREE